MYGALRINPFRVQWMVIVCGEHKQKQLITTAFFACCTSKNQRVLSCSYRCHRHGKSPKNPNPKPNKPGSLLWGQKPQVKFPVEAQELQYYARVHDACLNLPKPRWLGSDLGFQGLVSSSVRKEFSVEGEFRV